MQEQVAEPVSVRGRIMGSEQAFRIRPLPQVTTFKPPQGTAVANANRQERPMTESKLAPLTLDLLRTLVAGDTVAIRGTAKLEPAGGPGDKVFPPTHFVGDRADTRYAFEQRRIDGKEVTCVLLDSVQSQANRME